MGSPGERKGLIGRIGAENIGRFVVAAAMATPLAHGGSKRRRVAYSIIGPAGCAREEEDAEHSGPCVSTEDRRDESEESRKLASCVKTPTPGCAGDNGENGENA